MRKNLNSEIKSLTLKLRNVRLSQTVQIGNLDHGVSVDATCSIKLLVHVLVNKNDRFGVHRMEDVQKRMNRQNAKFVNHVNLVRHVTKQQTSAVIRYLWYFNSIQVYIKSIYLDGFLRCTSTRKILRGSYLSKFMLWDLFQIVSQNYHVSLIKSREKDITSMSHLVTRIEQNMNAVPSEYEVYKQSFGMYAAPNRKK